MNSRPASRDIVYRPTDGPIIFEQRLKQGFMTIKDKKKSDKAPSRQAPAAKKRPAAKVKPKKRKPKAGARPKSPPASAASRTERPAPPGAAPKATAPTRRSRPKTPARSKSRRPKPLQPEVIEPLAAERPKAKPKAKSKAKPKAKVAAGADKALVKFDPLQRYLAEISNYRLLTREEERTLGIRVREHGDKEAAYSLVTANLRLVVKIALEFQRVWMQNLLDLIQEGNIGLMQAVRKFDPYKNVKFSYYASFWIKAYILKFIMDNWRLVKIGTTQGQRKLFFKLKKEKQKLIEQGFDPKPKLLSERLGVSEREIVDMDQRLDGWDVSLDAPLKDDSDTERIEFLSTESVSAEDQVAKKEIEVLLHNKIDEFRKNMTDREKEIFDLRIFSDTPVTLQEIGDRYGISRERVRQVEKNIIKKMREFFRREIPDFSAYTEGQENE
jgi:RNA polymerase sigma-32 factor